jgi:golgi to ER traffic protein 4
MSSGYELHQKLRTKAVRQLKKKDYEGAINSLYEGSRQLLQEKEQGSGCDLAVYLLDVYQQSQTKSTQESRKKIIDLIQLSGNDFWRKKVIDAAIKWSIAVTSTPSGDGYLRLAIAEILSKDGSFHISEPHFIVACSPPPGLATSGELFPEHAPKSFALMMIDWLAAYAGEVVKEHGGNAATIERLGAGAFALRGLLPLLLSRALTASRAFLSIFTSRIVQKHADILLSVRPNPKPFSPPAGMAKPPGDAQQLYLTVDPVLNFAQMTLAMAATAVEHKKKTQGSRVPDALRDTWISAVNQFEKETGDEEGYEYFDQVLPDLSKIYFDIQPPRGGNANFMQDMLGSLMGGGDSSGSNTQTTIVRHAPAPSLPSKVIEAAKSGAAAGIAQPAEAGEEDLDLD